MFIGGLQAGIYTVTLTDGNGCQYIETVPVGTVGTDDAPGSEPVGIYPVPARDRLYWRGLPERGVVRARVYAPTGALVRTAMGEGLRSISLEGLPSGAYFLELDGRVFFFNVER